MNKNKKSLILVIIALLAAGALMFWGRNSSKQTNGSVSVLGSSLTAFGEQVPEFNFGTVSMANGKVAHDFDLVNNTNSDIAITRAETSCMCTDVLLKLPNGKKSGPFGMAGMGLNTPSSEIIIRPGEKLTAEAIFDPAAHGPAGIGKIARQITLYDAKGHYGLNFRAEVTP